jgi:tetratricopeptide (TPR) repeat protein
MKKSWKKSPVDRRADLKGKSAATQTFRLSGRKIWCFRLLMAIGGPALFLGLIELTLRLSGFGYPATFLLPFSRGGEKMFIQNNQFGWRFFGPKIARLPNPIFIPQVKAPGTVRIFVFGESAAYGDPQPDFGLPRMLQAMLSLRYPGIHFEVVNAAMTAINSNVIFPIARDCARANGDIWVIYMGNNEVVGPFGAGTVFGRQTPPLPLIHAIIALKATRTGQLLNSICTRIQKPPVDNSEWGGMGMFLNQQVQADDPRMETVYHHFQQNLSDIIRVGLHSGAGIVVSTVAVNLMDCAPFASSHRQNLSEPEQEKLLQLYQRGASAEESGKMREAAEDFHEAAQIDDSVAELRFVQGKCAAAQDDVAEAQEDLSAARDLDTLRFRCDSRLNDLIRQVASNREGEHVFLADSERVFAKESPDGLPGENFFYEHVHPNFDGNYLLARTIATQIEKLLPQQVVARARGNESWPSETDCAARLGWSAWTQAQAFSEVFTRLMEPPFTAQLNHNAQMQYLEGLMNKTASANQPDGLTEAQNICEKALTEVPDDWALHERLALLKQQTGDLSGAVLEAEKAADLMPSYAEGWARLGDLLAQEQDATNAVVAFHKALDLDPLNVWILRSLGLSEIMLGRPDEAIHDFKQAIALSPHYGPAWMGLGTVYEQMGHTTEAEDCYQKALANRIPRAPELMILARFCKSHSWFEAAATNYEDAIRLNPGNPKLRIEAGQNYAAWGRHEEAAQQFEAAVKMEPGSAQARLLLGLELANAGRMDEAVNELRAAVQIKPDLAQARLDLGAVLEKSGQPSEALAQFEEVLQEDPTNTLALKYLQTLQMKSNGK